VPAAALLHEDEAAERHPAGHRPVLKEQVGDLGGASLRLHDIGPDLSLEPVALADEGSQPVVLG
jgi:hypothetical protein